MNAWITLMLVCAAISSIYGFGMNHPNPWLAQILMVVFVMLAMILWLWQKWMSNDEEELTWMRQSRR